MARKITNAVVLTSAESDVLERNVREQGVASPIVARSRMILLAAEGLANDAIARRIGVSSVTVGVWRRRFVERRLEGLLDERRTGRPREIDDDRMEAVVLATLASAPEGAARWSTRSLAKTMGMS